MAALTSIVDLEQARATRRTQQQRDRKDVEALYDAVVSQDSTLTALVHALGDLETARGTIRAEFFEAEVWSLVEGLYDYGVRVAQ